MNKSTFAVFFVSAISAVSSALLQETFEVTNNVSAGSINGQNGWTLMSGAGTVQTAVVQAGAQALQILNGEVRHGLSSDKAGIWLQLHMRISAAPETDPFVSAPNTATAFFVNTNRNLVVYDGTNLVVLAEQVPLNTWMRFNVYCDYEVQRWALNVNGTNVAENLRLYSSGTNAAAVQLVGSGAGAVYIDDLSSVDQNAEPLPFEERFEAATGIVPGSVNGQKGWVLKSGAAAVQTDTVQSGSPTLRIQKAEIRHDLSNDGPFEWHRYEVYFDTFDAAFDGAPPFSTNAHYAFYVRTDGRLGVYSNQTPVTLNVQVTAGTWSCFDVFCDYENSTWCIGVNGTNAASGLPFYSSSQRTCPLTIFGSGYIDRIRLSSEEPVSEVPDSNGDGVPDWWQQKYMGGVTGGNVDTASQNSGLTYKQAYIAGLRPDIADPFSTTGIAQGHGFQWTPRYGRLYDVEWTTNLLSGFAPVATGIPWTQSEFIDDSARTNEVAGFYRLRVRVE